MMKCLGVKRREEGEGNRQDKNSMTCCKSEE
jgi:hypothetical protein